MEGSHTLHSDHHTEISRRRNHLRRVLVHPTQSERWYQTPLPIIFLMTDGVGVGVGVGGLCVCELGAIVGGADNSLWKAAPPPIPTTQFLISQFRPSGGYLHVVGGGSYGDVGMRMGGTWGSVPN